MEFTLIKPLFGGFLLGLAALSLLFFNGRVAGVSGILGGFLSFKKHDTLWRFAFLAGLVTGGVLLLGTFPNEFRPVCGSCRNRTVHVCVHACTFFLKRVRDIQRQMGF